MNDQFLHTENYVDDDGNPKGGVARGVGLHIFWQEGPIVNPETGERREPNGAFVETVIRAVINRIAHYQDTKFACEANGDALYYLGMALAALNKRTKEREERGVEGTHEV